MWCTFWAEDESERVQVVYHYQVRSGDPIVRKKVEIRKLGDSPRLLLDVDVEDFEVDGVTTDAGSATLSWPTTKTWPSRLPRL